MYGTSRAVKSIGNLLSMNKDKDKEREREKDVAGTPPSSSSSFPATASEKTSSSSVRSSFYNTTTSDRNPANPANFLVDLVQSTQNAAANINTIVNSVNSNLNATFTTTKAPSQSQRGSLFERDVVVVVAAEREKEIPSSPSKMRMSPTQEFFHKDTDFFENDGHDKVVELMENERLNVSKNEWGAKYLQPLDPKRYKSASKETDEFHEPKLPDHWKYVESWEVDTHGDFTEDGWMYGVSFVELDLRHYLPKSLRTVVRRKRWLRRVLPAAPPSELSQSPRSQNTHNALTQHTQSVSAKLFPRTHTNSSFTENGSVSLSLSENGSETREREKDALTDCDFEFEDERERDEESERERETETETERETERETSANAVSTSAVQPPPPPVSVAPTQPAVTTRRRSYFSFGSASADTTPTPTQPPAAVSLTPPHTPHTTHTTAPHTTYTGGTAARPHTSDPSLKIHSTTLSAIGKQLKIVENECKREDEIHAKHWKETEKPRLEALLAEAEKRLNALKTQMEREISRGAEFLNKLEEELLSVSYSIDEMKRKLYFPFASITLGNGGVYLAMEDFWLEYVSGSFALDLIPDRTSPRIVLKLRGTTPSPSSSSSTGGEGESSGHGTAGSASHATQQTGVNARLQIEKFQLAGDRGTSVPKLRFDLIKVTIAFSVSLSLQYDMKTSKWTADNKSFQITVHSFKGPYGLNKSIVSLVLSLLNPMLRNLLLQHIPYELGLLIRTFPSPFSLRGAFDLKGVDLNLMSQEWHKSLTLQRLTRLSPTQLEMFLFLQRSMEREKTMKTVGELMAYIKTHSRNRGIWLQLVNLWTQAMNLYCEKITLLKNGGQYATNANRDQLSLPEYTVEFHTFLSACESLTAKRVKLNFELHRVDGQLSINHLLSFLFQIIYRIANDFVTNATAVKRVQWNSLIEQIKRRYDEAVENLQTVSKNIDFAQLGLSLSLTSGDDGELLVNVRDILAQAPLSLNLSVLTDKNLGAIPLVPYIVSIKPQENGDLCVGVYHFTHDSTEESLLLQSLQTHTQDLLSSSQPTALLFTQREHTSHRTSQIHTRQAYEAYKKECDREKRLLSHTNYAQNIHAGCYSTSYNTRVDNITRRQQEKERVCGVVSECCVGENNNNIMTEGRETLSVCSVSPSQSSVLSSQLSHTTSSQRTHTQPTQPSQTTTYTQASHDELIQHLLVQPEAQREAVERVLNAHPQGDAADTLLLVNVTSPQVSMIVDQPTTLTSGAELFTLSVGKQHVPQNPDPQEREMDIDHLDFNPRGSLAPRPSCVGLSNSPLTYTPFYSLTPQEQQSQPGNSPSEDAQSASESGASVKFLGMPVSVHTAPGIKLFAQVPRVDVKLSVPSLLRFTLAHFADLLLLKSYLQILVGGTVSEEQLVAVKLVLDKLAKYLLVEGLDLKINLNGKMVAMNGEIMVRLETPDDTDKEALNEVTHTPPPRTNALVLNAQLSLRELFEDSKDIESIVKTAMTGGAL